MDLNLDAAVAFVATHGRVLDRHRLARQLGGGPPDAVLAALDAYRNADGGYGWGLEPDQRSVTSQPVGAMHALEVLAEAGSPAPELLDWLQAHANLDGGVPFGLPFEDTAGCAPHWVGADPRASSLQMTTQLAAQALRVPWADSHPWTWAATTYCLDAIERIDGRTDGEPHAYEVMFALAFLDSVGDARARELAAGLAKYCNADGPTPVTGGTEDEVLYPIDFAPRPGTAARAAFGEAAIEADLARLAGQQQPDGGWTVDYPAFSPAAELEWRGYRTVQVLRILQENSGELGGGQLGG